MFSKTPCHVKRWARTDVPDKSRQPTTSSSSLKNGPGGPTTETRQEWQQFCFCRRRLLAVKFYPVLKAVISYQPLTRVPFSGQYQNSITRHIHTHPSRRLNQKKSCQLVAIDISKPFYTVNQSPNEFETYDNQPYVWMLVVRGMKKSRPRKMKHGHTYVAKLGAFLNASNMKKSATKSKATFFTTWTEEIRINESRAHNFDN